jgi:hypothetical protein
MASSTHARKRAARSLPILFSLLWLTACGGPSRPVIDLDTPPEGTDRERLRTAMAQERPIFFETREGERFYGEVRSTGPERFELSEKEPFGGENPVPEEGNSTRGFVLGTTVIVVALVAVMALVAVFPVPSS